MYLLIVFLPLIGACVGGLGGQWLGGRGSFIVTSTCTALSALLSVLAFYEVGLLGSPCIGLQLTWIHCELFQANWGFLFDSLTVTMLIVVTVVSTLVHIYSGSYMETDPHLSRFCSYLSLFTFFMLMLVTADNFIQLFMGWEGVGLCSYLLIGFWFTRIQANKSAIKAIIVNRLGDFGITIGILMIFYFFKSVKFATVFSLVHHLATTSNNSHFLNGEFDALTLISLFLFIGAVGKSAQLGLHTWLPSAMEGPTPVSALIHAATMVTAGIFMIIRCSALFEYAPTTLAIVTLVGAMTAFFAATSGMLQNDLKKVIAYSTCSQLGYMIFACGLSHYSVSLFHVMNHAFFKALLFLSAGAVIHSMADEQDMRKMGGLVRSLPLPYIMIVIGSLALMGFPYLTGFYSKDVILELAYASYTVSGHFAHWLGTLSAFFTAFYSFRLLFLTFLSAPQGYKASYQAVHEAPFLLGFPLMVLAFGSIFAGYLFKDMMIGLGTPFFGNSIFMLPQHYLSLDGEFFLPYFIKGIPVLLSLLGAILALIFYYSFPGFSATSVQTSVLTQIPLKVQIYTFFNRSWFFDRVYNEWGGRFFMASGYALTFKMVDKGILELFGPLGISRTLQKFAPNVVYGLTQKGSIPHYAFTMILGVALAIILNGVFFIAPDFTSFFSELPKESALQFFLIFVVLLASDL